MNEFENTSWLGGHVFTYNYSGDNRPGKTGFAGTCLTNGCTYGVRGCSKQGISYYEYRIRKDYMHLKAGFGFWCPFTMDQIIQTLEDINEYIPFKFELTDKEDYYDLKLEVEQRRDYKEHFYIVTRVRYLYEFPQCALYYDAMRLKELDEFKNQSLTNLYALVVSSIANLGAGEARRLGLNIVGRSGFYDQYHSIPAIGYSNIDSNLTVRSPHYVSSFVTKEEEINFVTKRLKMSALNSLHTMKDTNVFGDIKQMSLELFKLYNSLEFWKNPKYLEGYRLPYYLNNLGYLAKEDKPSTELIEKASTQISEIEKNLSNAEYKKGLYDELKSVEYFKVGDKYRREGLLRQNEFHKAWSKEIMDKVVEWTNDKFEKEHPRDRYGRFVKKVNMEIIVERPARVYYRDRFGRFACRPIEDVEAAPAPVNELRI